MKRTPKLSDKGIVVIITNILRTYMII